MPAALAHVRAEWRRFRDDKPGERFFNHRLRALQHSQTRNVVSLALGVLLSATGVVLLFMPGPGIPLIVFGVALIASQSWRLSVRLDRAEPKLRAAGRRGVRWWRARSRVHKTTLALAVVAIATAAMLAIWNWGVAAYVS